MSEEYTFSAEELTQPSNNYEPVEFTFTPEELYSGGIKGSGKQYNIKTKQPIPTAEEQQVEALKRNPAYREQVRQFIESQAAPKSFKRRAVEALPMGNYIADRTMPFEYDPMHSERTVNQLFGSAPSAKTVPGAMVQGLGKFMRDPGTQIEAAISFPADVATTITKAFAGDKQAQQQVRSMPADLLAMTGIPDIVEGNFDAPLAREAWENNFLGSAMMAYPIAKGTVGLGRMAKQGLGKVGEAGLRMVTKPETAENLYRSAMKPTTKMGEQAAVGQAVQYGLEKGAVINRQGTGLEATLQRIESAENALQNILDTSTGEVKIGNLDRSLDTVRQAAFDDLVNRDAIQGAADDYIKMLREHPKYNPTTDTIPADVANVIKRKLYKNLRKGGAYDTGQVLAGKGEAAKGLAKGVMVELENVLPELGPLNKEMGKDLNLQRYLEKATARIQNSDTISLRGKLAMMLGFVKPAYAGASFLAAIADHPGFKSRLAIAIARAHKGKIGIAEARRLADTAVARMSEPQPVQQELFNPEVPGQRGPSTGFETIPMEPGERGLEAGERRFENPPTIKLEQMISNPEVLPPRQSSVVETTGLPVSGPGLEEGGVPPEVMTKPRVENPETLPPKQSSYADEEVVPQGNTNVDLGAMEQSLKEFGMTDEQIAKFKPNAMKLGIAGVKYPQSAMTGGTGRAGKFNYVIMSDDLVNINKMYTHPATVAASAALLYKLLGNEQDDNKLPVNAVIGAIAASGMLKPAVLRDGVVKSAPLGKTHYDVKTIEHGAKIRTEKTAGFITPDGEYLDRKQSLQWLRDHAPEVYEKLDETTKRHGLESTALSSASGNKSRTDSLADAFMRRQFGIE